MHFQEWQWTGERDGDGIGGRRRRRGGDSCKMTSGMIFVFDSVGCVRVGGAHPNAEQDVVCLQLQQVGHFKRKPCSQRARERAQEWARERARERARASVSLGAGGSFEHSGHCTRVPTAVGR